MGEFILFICLKSIKVTEKIAAETAGREAAVKAKEKIEGKYEDLKKKSQEKLAEQSTGSEALQSQIDGLKQLSNKMEEEIENNKIQKMKDDKKLEEIERVILKNFCQFLTFFDKELLEKESKCLQLEETHDEEIEHMKGKLKKLQRELEETTQLQVEKMTLEIKLQEMEEKMRSGGMEIATPKTDRKLNKVYGIFGKFYGKQKEENDGESSRSRCVIISQ